MRVGVFPVAELSLLAVDVLGTVMRERRFTLLNVVLR